MSSDGTFLLGENDREMVERLVKAGPDHRKFMRQIFVSVDITAPLYWWKEFDTYKIATVANSASTMHRIHSNPITMENFSCDKMSPKARLVMEELVLYLENTRQHFIECKSKNDWYDLIQLLPSGYNQLRTCTLNYETLRSMYFARREHKLDEWHKFCDWVCTLPYAKEFIIL